jgi:hypothetical protein
MCARDWAGKFRRACWTASFNFRSNLTLRNLHHNTKFRFFLNRNSELLGSVAKFPKFPSQTIEPSFAAQQRHLEPRYDRAFLRVPMEIGKPSGVLNETDLR